MGIREATIVLLSLFAAVEAYAVTIPFDPADFPDPSELLSEDLANSGARAMGLVVDHRALEPATTLPPPVGLDLSVQTTLVKVPQDLIDKLKELGLSDLQIESAIPVPKINVHKGLGARAEVGFSGVYFQGYRIIGGDFKINFLKPEEGLAWALRFGYTTASLGFLKTKTYTPQLLASKPLDFAEPYLGIGYQYATAQIEIELDPSLPVQRANGKGGGFSSFMGVAFKIPMIGAKATIEGAYSSAEAHSVSMKFGLSI